MLCKTGLMAFSSILRIKPLMRLSFASQRFFSVTSSRNDSFKIQDEADFKDKVLNSETPVIVDFFATWCAPCRLLTPRIETVIAEKGGTVNLAKVDIDELTDLALEYDVTSVPVLMAVKNGKEQGRMIGLQDEDKLRTFVNNVVPS